jgi:hypothetical protein
MRKARFWGRRGRTNSILAHVNNHSQLHFSVTIGGQPPTLIGAGPRHLGPYIFFTYVPSRLPHSLPPLQPHSLRPQLPQQRLQLPLHPQVPWERVFPRLDSRDLPKFSTTYPLPALTTTDAHPRQIQPSSTFLFLPLLHFLFDSYHLTT